MLYLAGQIKKAGRVDHQDAFLDYDIQERERGITIYSKQAFFTYKDAQVTIIDTPGHIDFSSEMERSLQVLDLAVLLINGQDRVQSHTQTIWECLKHYHVPTLLFVNKMDISYHQKSDLLKDLQQHCSSNVIDLSASDALEQISLCDESLLNEYLETDTLSQESLQISFAKRQFFPVFFGSALKNEGVLELMDAMIDLSLKKEYPDEFGARVFKITNDKQGKPSDSH